MKLGVSLSTFTLPPRPRWNSEGDGVGHTDTFGKTTVLPALAAGTHGRGTPPHPSHFSQPGIVSFYIKVLDVTCHTYF